MAPSRGSQLRNRHPLLKPVPATSLAVRRAAAQEGAFGRWLAVFIGAALALLMAWVLGVMDREFRRKAIVPIPTLEYDPSDPEAATRTFLETYHRKFPVIIKGAVGDHWPAKKLWTPEYLSSRCAASRVPVYEYDLDAKEWASLRDLGYMPLPEYFASEFGATPGDARRHDRPTRYALEMSLRSECPALLDDIFIPQFFTDDMLVRYTHKSAWPTGIFGPAGSRSGLHRDTLNLPFYMVLLRGRKHWRVFPMEDEGLNEYYEPEQNAFKAVDAFAPDLQKYPRLRDVARVYDGILEAGDAIYIPNGAPHAVINLEDTIAISGNFLDKRSLEFHRNVTCASPWWEDNNLCWGFDHYFDKHKSPALESMREASYYLVAGFPDRKAWCNGFLTSLRERQATTKKQEVREQAGRALTMVGDFCSAHESVK